jgi:hypothetical protein
MKELEALRELQHELMQRHNDLYCDGECDKQSLDIITKDVKEKFELIAQALTPPTAEQIIDELRKCEDLGCHDMIDYMPDCKSFTLFRQMRIDDIFEIDLVRFENGLVYIAKTYPPRLITLIGRFYEGVEK